MLDPTMLNSLAIIILGIAVLGHMLQHLSGLRY
jgi:hypothetical protein